MSGPGGRLRAALRLGRRVGAVPVEAPIRIARLAASRSRAPLRRRAPPPGARPGTLAIPPDAPHPRMYAMVYGPGRLEEREVRDVEDVAKLWRESAGVLWLDVQGFGDEAMLQGLRDLFEIHPLAMADVVNVPQRPKLEDYGDRHLIVARMAHAGGAREIDFEQVSLVLGPGFLVTFQERPGDVFEPVRMRLRAEAGPIRRMGADYLAYAILDAVVDGYFPAIEALGDELEDIEETMMNEPGPRDLARLHRNRRTLVSVHRVMLRQRDALNSMLREERSPFSSTARVYLRDAHDHASQLMDAVETYREIAVGLMDVYLSSVSNRMNEIVKTLTIMASLFIPLTFIAGVYGMNFEHMPELEWRFGYPAAWAFMIAVGVGLLAWFRWRGWLGSPEPRGRPPRGGRRR